MKKAKGQRSRETVHLRCIKCVRSEGFQNNATTCMHRVSYWYKKGRHENFRRQNFAKLLFRISQNLPASFAKFRLLFWRNIFTMKFKLRWQTDISRNTTNTISRKFHKLSPTNNVVTTLHLMWFLSQPKFCIQKNFVPFRIFTKFVTPLAAGQQKDKQGFRKMDSNIHSSHRQQFCNSLVTCDYLQVTRSGHQCYGSACVYVDQDSRQDLCSSSQNNRVMDLDPDGSEICACFYPDP